MASEPSKHYSKVERGYNYSPALLPGQRPPSPAAEEFNVFTDRNKSFCKPGSYSPTEGRASSIQESWDSTSAETRIGAIDDAAPSQNHVLSKLIKAFSFLLGILWLVPAIALVYLNATDYVIGASAWCPRGSCNVINYHPNPNHTYAQNAAKADSNDGIVLGMLQFTAKAMEVWFCFIAVGLVYLVSGILARRGEGIPLGYLLTHLEFSDLRILFSSSLWNPIKHSRCRSASHITPGKPRFYLYLFVFLVVFMCLVTNFMSPSIAVLMIPSLDWIAVEYHPVKSFRQEGSQLDSVFLDSDPVELPQHLTLPSCEPEDFGEEDLSCTFKAYAGVWDAMVGISAGIVQQQFSMEREQATLTKIFEDATFAPSLEYEIPFSFNITPYNQGTNYSESAWAPNRQVLREIAMELEPVFSAIRGDSKDSPYAEFDNSLRLVLERDGPILGMDSVALYGEARTIRMDNDPDKVVACTLGYAYLGENEVWSKCHQVGLSWNRFNRSSFFFEDEEERNIRVDFHWVEKMAYFRGDRVSDLPACLQSNESSSTDCVWDDILIQPTSEDLPEQLKARARPTLFGRYYFVEVENNERPLSNYTLACITEYFPYTGIATYTFDITDIFPSRSEVEITRFPEPEMIEPLIFHPNWMLAIWSVDTHNLDSEDRQQLDWVNNYRSSSAIMEAAINDLINLEERASEETDQKPSLASTYYNIALFSGLQALSIVPYNTTTQAVEGDASQQTRYPALNVWFRRQVWKFGLGSSASRLGLVVVSFGMLSVLARSILFFLVCNRPYSTASLIASALRHSPNREFDNLESDSQYARVRFMIRKKNGNGHLVFRKTW